MIVYWLLWNGSALQWGHGDVITAELAQSVERTTLNRVVVGSIPIFGGTIILDNMEDKYKFACTYLYGCMHDVLISVQSTHTCDRSEHAEMPFIYI